MEFAKGTKTRSRRDCIDPSEMGSTILLGVLAWYTVANSAIPEHEYVGCCKHHTGAHITVVMVLCKMMTYTAKDTTAQGARRPSRLPGGEQDQAAGPFIPRRWWEILDC